MAEQAIWKRKNRGARAAEHHCGPVAIALTGVKVYKQIIHLRFKT